MTVQELDIEKTFSRQSVTLNFAELSNMIMRDLNERNSQTTKAYTKANVVTYLANPRRYTKELVDMSTNLYNQSPHYRRVVNYFAKLSTLDYIIEPYGISSDKINDKPFLSSFQKTIDYLEMMNLK